MAQIKATAQQTAIMRELTESSNHLAIVARAGCGKTSTILMAVDAIADERPGAEVLVCAFNKAIADEVGEKLRERGHTDFRRTQAVTLHSLGLGLLKRAFNLTRDSIDDKKVQKIVGSMTDGVNSHEVIELHKQYGAQIIALTKMAKQAGFGFFSDLSISDVAAWQRLADHYDIDGLDDTTQAEEIIAAAQRVYSISLQRTDVIDFDDMILMPLIKNLRVRFTKDFVFLDEAQDLSRARQALARKFIGPDGRMIVVGDDRQAIYGFSGADAAALDNLIAQLGARKLPLSVTWRCPKAVVALAQTLVPDIEAAPSALEGQVLRIQHARHLAPRTAGQNGPAPSATSAVASGAPWYSDPEGPVGPLTKEDAILCRNTAPLVSLAFELIRAGIGCKVEGRNIGDGLKDLARRWRIKTTAQLRKRLEAFCERERQKALARGNEAKAEEVKDRVDTLVEICAACEAEGQTLVTDVVARIDAIFADDARGVVVLATYHRSKGREWPRVFLLEHAQRCPSKAARQPWQVKQEHNLAYVAFTRAQQALVFVG